jgi:hypothetical protein
MGLLIQPKAAPRGAVHTVDPPANLGPGIRITPQARYYALGELARRAGIPMDFFRTWKVTVTREKTIFEISNGTTKYISFPHANSKHLKDLAAGNFSFVTVPLAGNLPGPGDTSISYCVVPFVAPVITERRPLFHLTDQNHLECAVDLSLSILLTLSRWEELLDTPRDLHGRFQAKSSIASAGGFLNRPIIDEYGLAFEQAMGLLYPSWKKIERKLRIKVSHDADHVGIPFRWRTAVRHCIRSRSPFNSVRDMSSLVSGSIEPSELKSVRDISTASLKHGLSSTVYWKAGPPGPMDSGYDPRHKRVRAVVNWLREIGGESGAQPGYNTFRSPEKLRREIVILRDVLGEQPLGGRQHYLRWCPDTWIDWENCGMAYDSTVGFAEQIGFRAGTCIPYRPWLFPLNRQADLLEIPLVVMDRTLLGYMGFTREESIHEVRKLLARCRSVGGVFTILWHNDAFLDPFYRNAYLSMLESLQGIDNYDWQAEAAHSYNGG